MSLEKCFGPGPSETNVWATAKQLKDINPELKVNDAVYFNVLFI